MVKDNMVKNKFEIIRFLKKTIFEKTEGNKNFFPPLFKVIKESPFYKYFLGRFILSFFVFLSFLFLSFNIVAGNLENTDEILINLIWWIRNSLGWVFDKIALFFTILGDWQVVLILTITTFVYFLFTKRIKEIIFLFVSLSAGFWGEIFFKNLIRRLRPDSFYALFEKSGFAFPSGHSIAAITFYGFIFYILLKESKNLYLRILFTVIGILVVVGIGFSRFYLGLHWFSDVLGGWLLGFSILLLVIALRELEGKIQNERFINLNFLPNLEKQKNGYLFIFSALSIIFIFNFYSGVVFKAEEEKSTMKNYDIKYVEKNFPSIDEIFKDDYFPQNVYFLSPSVKYPISLIILGDKEKVQGLFEKAGGVLLRTNFLENVFNLFLAPFFNSQKYALPLHLHFKKPLFIFEELKCGGKKCLAYVWDTDFYYKNQKIFVVSLSLENFYYEKYQNDLYYFSEIRDNVSASISKTGLIAQFKEFSFVKPFLVNLLNKTFFYDGRIYFLEVLN